MKIVLRDKLTGLYLSRAGESPNFEDAVTFYSEKQAVHFCDFHRLSYFEVVVRLGVHSEIELVVSETGQLGQIKSK